MGATASWIRVLGCCDVKEREPILEPCLRQNTPMHPKCREMFNSFFPTKRQSPLNQMLTEFSGPHEKGMSVWLQESVYHLHMFAQSCRLVVRKEWHPIINKIIALLDRVLLH